MDELADLLSHVRGLLGLLLFKLVEGRHLLAAGQARFLPYAAAEMERAGARVGEAELRRSILVHRLARDLHLPDEQLTLRAFARYSAEPYPAIFGDHRHAFLELTGEIEEVTGQNRHLATAGERHVEQRSGLGNPDVLDLRTYGPGSDKPVATADVATAGMAEARRLRFARAARGKRNSLVPTALAVRKLRTPTGAGPRSARRR